MLFVCVNSVSFEAYCSALGILAISSHESLLLLSIDFHKTNGSHDLNWESIPRRVVEPVDLLSVAFIIKKKKKRKENPLLHCYSKWVVCPCRRGISQKPSWICYQAQILSKRTKQVWASDRVGERRPRETLLILSSVFLIDVPFL